MADIPILRKYRQEPLYTNIVEWLSKNKIKVIVRFKPMYDKLVRNGLYVVSQRSFKELKDLPGVFEMSVSDYADCSYYCYSEVFYFENDTDALLFKLTWL